MSPSAPQRDHFWPTWLRIWFWVQITLLTFDASFVLTRPYSFKDGPLGFMYPAFQKYAEIDTVYADVSNSFGWAMSTLALIENSLIAYTLLIIYPADCVKDKKLTSMVMQKSDFMAFATVFMQISKTFFYFLNDGYSGFAHVRHNSAVDLITMFIIPNLIWFIVPAIIVSTYFIPKITRTVAACDKSVKVD